MRAPDRVPADVLRLPLASTPTVSIVLSLEDPAPSVRCGCRTNAERDRLEVWLRSKPALWRLLKDACDLDREAKAA